MYLFTVGASIVSYMYAVDMELGWTYIPTITILLSTKTFAWFFCCMNGKAKNTAGVMTGHYFPFG